MRGCTFSLEIAFDHRTHVKNKRHLIRRSWYIFLRGVDNFRCSGFVRTRECVELYVQFSPREGSYSNDPALLRDSRPARSLWINKSFKKNHNHQNLGSRASERKEEKHPPRSRSPRPARAVWPSAAEWVRHTEAVLICSGTNERRRFAFWPAPQAHPRLTQIFEMTLTASLRVLTVLSTTLRAATL
jgi:hypothetical protein